MASNGLQNGHPPIETPANRVANGETPENWVACADHPVYARRKLRVVCIGAGYSGLTLAHKIYHELKINDVIELVIYEKNSKVGGTWFENTYPGVACDIPAHAYTFLFEPNPNWSHFYASGSEIHQYIQLTAKKWNLDRDIQFNSHVRETVWDDELGKWKIQVDQAGALKQDEADILVNATGFLSKTNWPVIDGLSDFKGKLVHTSKWDHDFDWANKRVAVIGNGSSGIQCVAAMQPKVKQLVNFVRNPTWVSVNFCVEKTHNGSNFKYTEEQKKEFADDAEAHFKYRRELEASVNGFFYGMYKDHPFQLGLTVACKQQMAERMKGISNSEVVSKMLSLEFNPGCRRLTPGDGYLEAFANSNAVLAFDPIERITEHGIKTKNGNEQQFDMIVCATGFDTTFIPSWKLVGRNGAVLDERWKTNPEAFFTVQVDTMPNYFIFNGPNCPISHGSVLTEISWTCDYILKWTKKIATEDIKSIDVKREAVDDYNVYAQEFLKRMVWSDGCRSWYKNGKRSGHVTGVYPGSILHYKDCLENIGGEHFNIEYRSKNRFRFLGNGESVHDKHGAGDLAYYMDDLKASAPRKVDMDAGVEDYL
ncbi:hypothetical protein N7474_002279 [Penicillium riverlandense]|uniref:uncharacterized protein n=1 Tax=Penicillium riverlandense TaxID=1903569 RepID=UPI002548AA0E|nr:uncharacterized protein N7474_002279 [Penicillium riverlandense]KAJ5833968.1 hypothetical protein N7474_002279 [Penicillium riverlandense]